MSKNETNHLLCASVVLVQLYRTGYFLTKFLTKLSSIQFLLVGNVYDFDISERNSESDSIINCVMNHFPHKHVTTYMYICKQVCSDLNVR